MGVVVVVVQVLLHVIKFSPNEEINECLQLSNGLTQNIRLSLL